MSHPPIGSRRARSARIALALLVATAALAGAGAAPASAAPASAASADGAASAAGPSGTPDDVGRGSGPHGPNEGMLAQVTFDTVWSSREPESAWVRSVAIMEQGQRPVCLDLARVRGGLPTRVTELRVGRTYGIRSFHRPGCATRDALPQTSGTITPYGDTWVNPDRRATYRVHATTGPTRIR